MLRIRNFRLMNQVRMLGSIRSAGGSLGKRGEVQEEEYFFKQRHQQLAKLKQKKITDKEFEAEAIKQHQEAIEYHKREVDEFKSGKKMEKIKKEVEIEKDRISHQVTYCY